MYTFLLLMDTIQSSDKVLIPVTADYLDFIELPKV